MIAAIGEPLIVPDATRNCCRCGKSFVAFGRESVCTECRLPKAKQPRAGTGLSFRQRQIVALVAQAKLNKEIAWELQVTEGTIKQYLHEIFRRVGVSNRTQLALRARALLENTPDTPVLIPDPIIIMD